MRDSHPDLRAVIALLDKHVARCSLISYVSVTLLIVMMPAVGYLVKQVLESSARLSALETLSIVQTKQIDNLIKIIIDGKRS